MIIVKPVGAFGNNLFQYAFAKHLALQRGFEEIELDNKFGGSILVELGLAKKHAYLSYAYRIVFFHRHLFDKVCSFLFRKLNIGYTLVLGGQTTDLPLKKHKNIIVHGRFQSFELWSENADTIRKEIVEKITRFADVEFIKKDNRLGIHIRRGDYFDHPYIHTIGALNFEYYESAIREILYNNQFDEIVIFTDEPNHIDVLEIQKLFNTSIAEGNMFEDFVEMMNCSHLLISNSTFSCWAAFLGFSDTPAAVWAPTPWSVSDQSGTTCIIPTDWNLCESKWHSSSE